MEIYFYRILLHFGNHTEWNLLIREGPDGGQSSEKLVGKGERFTRIEGKPDLKGRQCATTQLGQMKFFIAFDVGRTLPNTDLSRDFMGLVVGRSVDLGTHI